MDVKKEIQDIKKRNRRVEADKVWETSMFRRIVIAAMTYVIVGIFLLTINVSKPWLNALVPTVGFILSTLTLPFIKRWWIKRNSLTNFP